MTTLVTNGARFEHLIGLARQYEKSAPNLPKRDQPRALTLAAVYRDMAFEAMPSAAVISELRLTERARLAIKLLENGCTDAEAENAAQLLLKLEGGK